MYISCIFTVSKIFLCLYGDEINSSKPITLCLPEFNANVVIPLGGCHIGLNLGNKKAVFCITKIWAFVN